MRGLDERCGWVLCMGCLCGWFVWCGLCWLSVRLVCVGVLVGNHSSLGAWAMSVFGHQLGGNIMVFITPLNPPMFSNMCIICLEYCTVCSSGASACRFLATRRRSLRIRLWLNFLNRTFSLSGEVNTEYGYASYTSRLLLIVLA